MADSLEYYRRYLDDPELVQPIGPAETPDPGTETTEVEYFRRYLNDPHE